MIGVPHRVIVSNSAENFGTKHISKNVEELFLLRKPESRRSLATLKLRVDISSDLVVH